MVNLRHHAKLRRFLSIFHVTAAAILDFLTFEIFSGRARQQGRTASPYKISWQSVKSSLRYGDFSILQDGGHPPCWICHAHV